MILLIMRKMKKCFDLIAWLRPVGFGGVSAIAFSQNQNSSFQNPSIQPFQNCIDEIRMVRRNAFYVVAGLIGDDCDRAAKSTQRT
jgi:hypothetical protein